MIVREQRPSRDQLQLMLGKLQSRLDAVESTIDYVNNIHSDLESESIWRHVQKLRKDLDREKMIPKPM